MNSIYYFQTYEIHFSMEEYNDKLRVIIIQWLVFNYVNRHSPLSLHFS